MVKNLTLEFDDLRIIDGTDISSNFIHTTDDYEKLKTRIEIRVRYYRLDAMLLKIHNESLIESDQKLSRNFFHGMMAKYAILNCNVFDGFEPVYDEEYSDLFSMVAEYSLYGNKLKNEIKSKADREESLASLLLIMLGQARWNESFNDLDRILFLYSEMIKDEKCPDLIKKIVNFGFEEKFGISFLNFINIGILIYAKSKRKNGMNRGYFDIARTQNLSIPNDDIVKKCLNQVACYPSEFKELCKSDRLIGEHHSAHELNPLFTHPIIRPWNNSEQKEPKDDKFIAPVPYMVFYRFTMGLYYQLCDNFKGFTDAFGHLFEMYVGKLLCWYKLPGKVLYEDEIQQYLPTTYNGKKPDYVVFCNEGVVLIECKATKYTQDMYEHGTNAKAKSCIKQIKKGIIQMDEFEAEVPSLSKSIGFSYTNIKLKKIVLTFDNLRGLKEGPLRGWVNREYKKEKINSDWQILWVGDFENIQPYITQGANFWEVLSDFDKKRSIDVLNELVSKTHVTYLHGFLHKFKMDFINNLIKNKDD
jgi:hypothetical protein